MQRLGQAYLKRLARACRGSSAVDQNLEGQSYKHLFVQRLTESVTKLAVRGSALANDAHGTGQSGIFRCEQRSDQRGHVSNFVAIGPEEVVKLTTNVCSVLVRVAEESTSTRSCLVHFY